jgi:hypothetical protein
MTMPEEGLPIDKSTELCSLAEAACNGTITAAQYDRLNGLLSGDEDAARFYATYVRMHGLLLWHWRDADVAPKSSPGLPIVFETSPTSAIPTVSFANLFSTGGYLFSYVLAVFIVGAGLLIGWACRVPDNQQIASNGQRSATTVPASARELVFVGRITGMFACQWADPKTEAFNGAYVSLGRKYALAAGLMEITYDTGAKVIVEGPCTYEVESKSSGYLSLGRLTAKVEERGEKRGEMGAKRDGKTDRNQSYRQETLRSHASPSPLSPLPSPLFAIRTPTAIVTDLGTEFGVECDKSGATRSNVFRGSVRFETASADGKPLGISRVLSENESARIERTSATGGRETLQVVAGPLSKTDDFVRKMPTRTIRVFNLVETAPYVDGRPGRRGWGINPTSGQVVDKPLSGAMYGDQRYHRVETLPFVDGVFIPDGRSGPVQVDSAGHTCAEFPKTANVSPNVVWVYGDIPADAPTHPTVLNGVDYSTSGHSVLFLHANQAITFDLDAVRLANPGCKLLQFRATAGNTETASVGGEKAYADLWVLVDGQVRYQRRKINGMSGAFHIAISLRENDRFLTLAGTDGGNGIESDWIVFGDPRLELTAVESGRPTDSQRKQQSRKEVRQQAQ